MSQNFPPEPAVARHNNDANAHPGIQRLPDVTAANAGMVLTVDTMGVWAVETPSGGGGGGDVYYDGFGLRAANWTGTTNRNAIGTGAVDLQQTITDPGQVAAASYSFIGSGNNNKAAGEYAAVVNGWNNQALGRRSFISNGYENIADNACSTVINGESNSATNIYATVVAGTSNTASGFTSVVVNGCCCTVSGGQTTLVAGGHATIPQPCCDAIMFASSAKWEGLGGRTCYTLAFQYAAALQIGDTALVMATARVVFQDAYGNYFVFVADIGIAYGEVRRVRIHVMAAHDDYYLGDYDSMNGGDNASGAHYSIFVDITLFDGKLMITPTSSALSGTVTGSVELQWNIVGPSNSGDDYYYYSG